MNFFWGRHLQIQKSSISLQRQNEKDLQIINPGFGKKSSD